jgi:hypothetical protein
MKRRPTQKQISFARNLIAGQAPAEALRNSLYNLENMTDASVARMANGLLNSPVIADAYAKAQADTLAGGVRIREDLIAELENIAFSNLGDFLKFETDTVLDSRGKVRKVLLFELKHYDELTPDQLACISEISEGQNGKIRVKLKSASDALAQLRKLHGWDAPPKATVGQDGKDVAPVLLQITRDVVE